MQVTATNLVRFATTTYVFSFAGSEIVEAKVVAKNGKTIRGSRRTGKQIQANAGMTTAQWNRFIWTVTGRMSSLSSPFEFEAQLKAIWS